MSVKLFNYRTINKQDVLFKKFKMTLMQPTKILNLLCLLLQT